MKAPSIFAGAVAVALVGCAAPMTPPMVVECSTQYAGQRLGPALPGVEYGTRMSPIPLDSVQFDDVTTTQAIAIQGLFAERAPTDTVHLEARLVSCSDQPMTVRARTSFQRSNGAPAEPTSAWQTLVLPPRAMTLYRENSIARDVRHYVIELAKER